MFKPRGRGYNSRPFWVGNVPLRKWKLSDPSIYPNLIQNCTHAFTDDQICLVILRKWSFKKIEVNFGANFGANFGDFVRTFRKNWPSKRNMTHLLTKLKIWKLAIHFTSGVKTEPIFAAHPLYLMSTESPPLPLLNKSNPTHVNTCVSR